MFYQDLFNIQGYQDFIGCRIHIIDSNCFHSLVFGVPSHICRMYTNCRKNHATSDAAIQARAAQDQIVSNKEYVHQQLKKGKSNVQYASHQHVMELLLHI